MMTYYQKYCNGLCTGACNDIGLAYLKHYIQRKGMKIKLYLDLEASSNWHLHTCMQ